jgi:hypothetical protein
VVAASAVNGQLQVMAFSIRYGRREKTRIIVADLETILALPQSGLRALGLGRLRLEGIQRAVRDRTAGKDELP